MPTSLTSLLARLRNGLAQQPKNTIVTLWCSALVFAVWALGNGLGWPDGEVVSALICAICGFSAWRAGKEPAEAAPAAERGDTPTNPPAIVGLWFLAAAALSVLSLFSGGCAELRDVVQWDGLEVGADIVPASSGKGLETNGLVTSGFTLPGADVDFSITWTEHSAGGCLYLGEGEPVCVKVDRDTGVVYGATVRLQPRRKVSHMKFEFDIHHTHRHTHSVPGRTVRRFARLLNNRGQFVRRCPDGSGLDRGSCVQPLPGGNRNADDASATLRGLLIGTLTPILVTKATELLARISQQWSPSTDNAYAAPTPPSADNAYAAPASAPDSEANSRGEGPPPEARGVVHLFAPVGAGGARSVTASAHLPLPVYGDVGELLAETLRASGYFCAPAAAAARGLSTALSDCFAADPSTDPALLRFEYHPGAKAIVIVRRADGLDSDEELARLHLDGWTEG